MSTRSDSPKTVPTATDVESYLAGLPAARQADCRALVTEMTAITGQQPVLWGPSIVGFGSYHYRYASGREGDAPELGFASRGPKLTLYLAHGVGDFEAELDRLGPHSVGKGCLYLKRLADVDMAVLREILVRSLAGYAASTEDPRPPTYPARGRAERPTQPDSAVVATARNPRYSRTRARSPVASRSATPTTRTRQT